MFLVQIINFTSGNYTSGSLLAGGGSSTYVLLIAIALVLTLRMYRGMTGTKFKRWRLYFLPIVYLALVFFSLPALSLTYVDIAVVLGSIIAGGLLGLRYGGGVQFYDKNSQIYYKRSPVIMMVWLASYIGRFAVGLLVPSNFYINFAVEIALALTTGLIAGEAYHIYNKYKEYKKEDGARIKSA